MHEFGKALVFRATAFLTTSLMACQPAFAHHPMGGAVPATWWQGLLSGLGHPVLELDHLAFLIGAAVAVAMCKVSYLKAIRWLASFAVAGALGTALQTIGIGVPWTEFLILASLLAVALSLWLQRVPGFYVTALMSGAAGLAHGYAYGEAIVGAEATPLLAYLAGLALIQTALLALVCVTVRPLPLVNAPRWQGISRALGVLIAFVGVWSGVGVLE